MPALVSAVDRLTDRHLSLSRRVDEFSRLYRGYSIEEENRLKELEPHLRRTGLTNNYAQITRLGEPVEDLNLKEVNLLLKAFYYLEQYASLGVQHAAEAAEHIRKLLATSRVDVEMQRSQEAQDVLPPQ